MRISNEVKLIKCMQILIGIHVICSGVNKNATIKLKKKKVRFLPTLSICFTATGGDETCGSIYSSALVSVY